MLIVSVNLFLMRIVSMLFLFWEGEGRRIEHWRAPMNNCQTNTSWRTTTKSRTRILDFLSHSVSTLFTFPLSLLRFLRRRRRRRVLPLRGFVLSFDMSLIRLFQRYYLSSILRRTINHAEEAMSLNARILVILLRIWIFGSFLSIYLDLIWAGVARECCLGSP